MNRAALDAVEKEEGTVESSGIFLDADLMDFGGIAGEGDVGEAGQVEIVDSDVETFGGDALGEDVSITALGDEAQSVSFSAAEVVDIAKVGRLGNAHVGVHGVENCR